MSVIPVSIIVPVYQTRRSLPGCLNSLLNQSFTDVEIIVIDDASPDAAGEIASEYAQRYKRLKVIVNPINLGLYASRFVGSSAACGRYIAFCDSDDQMPVGAIEALYKVAEKKQADVVHGRARALTDKGGGAKLRVYDPFTATDGLGFTRAMLQNARGWNIWGKLYRLDAWNRAATHLPTAKRLFLAEDILISFAVGMESKKYAETGETVYLYRQSLQNYFSDSAQAHSRVSEQLEVLTIIRDLAATMPNADALAKPMQFFIHYVTSSMVRNLSGFPELQKEAAFATASVFGNAYLSPTAAYRQWHPRVIASRLCEFGMREFTITLHRTFGAVKKRGWRRVLNEIRSL